MNHCEALGYIREARALLRVEQKLSGSRELAMVLTKLDEAEMWRQSDMQLKSGVTANSGGGPGPIKPPPGQNNAETVPADTTA